MGAHLFSLGDDLGHVQKRLGGDAADIEADTAQRGARLDEHGLLAEVGGAEGSSVATRAGAQHNHFGMHIARAGGRARGGDRRGRACSRRLRRGGRSRCFFCARAFEGQDHGPFGDLVTFGNFDLFDHAGRWRRHFHGGLVRLQFNERVLFGHGVAHADQNGNDGHIGEITDIGYFDVHRSFPCSGGARRKR